MASNQNRVYFYILYSIIASTLMYAIVKYLVSFDIYQIIFFRSLGTLIFTIPLIVTYKIHIFGNNKSILLLRSIFGVFSMTFFFLSLKYIDLGISVTIRFMSPIFAVFFALLFLKERIKNIQWIFISISFLGVIFIKGFGDNISHEGLIFSLISAILLGIVFVITSKIGNTESSLVILNYFMFMALIFGGILSINNWINPTNIELLLLLSSGFFGYIGLLYLTKAFQISEVNIVAPFKYLEVILNIIVGLAFFNEIYTFWTLFGIVLILIGVILNFTYKKL